MSADTKHPIPVNIISGPLGVGKTTAINHLLAQRPDHEKWAVLINEFGMVGLDAALLGDAARSKDVAVREVAGGCICCSASFMFDVSLVLLLQRRPDRLIIEPTGLATLSGILDTLSRKGIREAVDVRSIVTLLDPATYRDDIQREDVRDQVDAADILVAGRLDLVSPEQLKAFETWAQDIFPPKRHIDRVEQGRMPLDLLDLVTDRPTSASDNHDQRPLRHLDAHDAGTAHDHSHDHLHGHNASARPHSVSGNTADELVCDANHPIVRRNHRSTVAATVGWICWNGLVFDSSRTKQWLMERSKSTGSRRVKAVVRTDEGWWSFNATRGAEEIRPTGYRRDSRLELVLERDAPIVPQELEASLRECLA